MSAENQTPLLPCPFCGNKAEFQASQHSLLNDWARCLRCTIGMPPSQWNARAPIEKALEALAAEKDRDIAGLRADIAAKNAQILSADWTDEKADRATLDGKLAAKIEAQNQEIASLRSEVERLKGDEKYRHEQQYLLQKEVQAKHEQLTLALKERDAYREIALAGIETLNGGVLTKGLIEATDAQAQKLSSEGKK